MREGYRKTQDEEIQKRKMLYSRQTSGMLKDWVSMMRSSPSVIAA